MMMSQPEGMMDASATMEGMRSPLNPTDMAAMQEQGPQIDPERTTVRQILEMQGIDVDGPVMQLEKLMSQQVHNADIGNKMSAVAQAPPAANPLSGGMGPGEAGLDGLMH